MTACTFIFELKSYKIFVVYALNLTLYSCVEDFKPFDLKQKTCKPLATAESVYGKANICQNG
jgi:hypothetical protein